MGKIPFMFDNPEEESQNDLTPDELVQVIMKMYLPAASVTSANDLISHADLVESVRNNLQKVNSHAVFTAMTDMGFESKTIEGTIYWLVLYA